MRQIMARVGIRAFDELVGRVERLQVAKAIDHYKAKGLDFSAIFHQPDVSGKDMLRLSRAQPDKLGNHLDWQILEKATAAIEKRKKTVVEMPIRNVNRTVGTILSNRVVSKYGPQGLPAGTLEIVFRGSAGQSFGAFLAPGITLR